MRCNRRRLTADRRLIGSPNFSIGGGLCNLFKGDGLAQNRLRPPLPRVRIKPHQKPPILRQGLDWVDVNFQQKRQLIEALLACPPSLTAIGGIRWWLIYPKPFAITWNGIMLTRSMCAIWLMAVSIKLMELRLCWRCWSFTNAIRSLTNK